MLSKNSKNLRLSHAALMICALGATACATVKDKKPEASTSTPVPVVLDKNGTVVGGATTAISNVNELEKIIAENNPLMDNTDEKGEKIPIHVPVEINQRVSDWVDYFTVRDRERTIRFLERGIPLRPYLQQILKDNDVPPELFYLAMIESGFVTHAKSRARAVGVWQFMRATGKNYGLAVNAHVDERRNWIKATEAAATYLKDLNNVFGSWYLALAAYNAGENRIVRSIMKGKTRDFWALAESGMLPKETLDYVPKFLAAQIVGKNLEKYNLRIQPQADDIWEDYGSVTVPSGVSLKALAKAVDVSYETIKRWNEDLIKDHTPYARAGTVEIYVPKNLVQKFESNRVAIEQIKRVKLQPEKERSAALVMNDGKGAYEYYIVQQGESLYTISKQLKISVRTLMKINGLRKSRIHPGQRVRYYKVAGAASFHKNPSRGLASSKKKKKKQANNQG